MPAGSSKVAGSKERSANARSSSDEGRGWRRRGGTKPRWHEMVPARACVCLLGDSMMRNLANRLLERLDPTCHAMVYQVRGKASCIADKLWTGFVRFGVEAIFSHHRPSSQQMLKTGLHVFETRAPGARISASDNHTFSNGQGKSNDTERMQESRQEPTCHSCSAILLNMGRWPLGGNRGTTHGRSPHLLPWTLEQYAAQVVKLLRWLRAVGAHEGIPVAFLSTAPMPLHGGGAQLECRAAIKATGKGSLIGALGAGGTELPHAIGAYNAIAQVAAAHLNVTYIDVASRTLDLLDVTFDGAHFYDPLALAAAQEVERWLTASL